MIDIESLATYSFHALYEPNASLLNSIVLGIPFPKAFSSYEDVHRAGLVHVLVLSGGNLTILGRTVEVITEGFNKKFQLVLILLVITFFCFIVGFKAPLLRSYLMSICTIVALLIGRPLIGLFGLFVSGIVILIIDRAIFTSISFQLSYGATLGILSFTPLLEAHMRYLRSEDF
ncbi:MAG: Competence protein [Microgenomates bacterium OLB22]|nr:MAG: Competence protein [Microgenomates bacterium OLB22]